MLSAAAAASPHTVAASHLPIAVRAPWSREPGRPDPTLGWARGAPCRAHRAGLPLPESQAGPRGSAEVTVPWSLLSRHMGGARGGLQHAAGQGKGWKKWDRTRRSGLATGLQAGFN